MKQAINYSDIDFINGITSHDLTVIRAFHRHCKRYFDMYYRSLFFVDEECKKDIFQESLITLWEKIEHKKIYVEDNIIKGKKGEPFIGKLTTYLMSIARFKYKEWTRENLNGMDSDLKERKQIAVDMETYQDMLYDEDDNTKLEIIADCISHMSERCSQILSMFYYENKTLDDIMLQLSSFESKDALKTAKYKCMENLRKSANNIYSTYFNS